LAYILLPLVALLSVAIVYMGYHYAVDSLAGIGAALISYFLSGRIEARWETHRRQSPGPHHVARALSVPM